MSVNPAPVPIIPAWTLGDRMRKARRHAGIGVSEMAEHLAVDRDTINNYEADRSNPRRSVLFHYAAICGVSLGWLETGSVPDQPTNAPTGRKPRRPPASTCSTRLAGLAAAC